MMKTTSVFWGVMLIVAGILLFILQFDSIAIDYSLAKYLWPLIIVFIGVSLLNIPEYLKGILAGLSGAIFAFFLFGLFSGAFFNSDCCEFDVENVFNRSPKSFTNESVYLLDSSTKSAVLSISGSAGNIKFDGTTSDLIRTFSNQQTSDINLTDIDSSRTKIDFETYFDRIPKENAYSKIELNPNIKWDINFESAANKIDADLRKYIIDNIKFESAASSFYLKIGKRQDTVKVKIESALSNFYVEIPKAYACKIDVQAAFGNNYFEGFTEDNGVFTTGNYGKTNKVIFIEIEAGLSNTKVYRK